MKKLKIVGLFVCVWAMGCGAGAPEWKRRAQLRAQEMAATDAARAAPSVASETPPGCHPAVGCLDGADGSLATLRMSSCREAPARPVLACMSEE